MQQFRKTQGIPLEDTLLLSVGELNENKNHEIVIRALAGLEGFSIHYMIAGQGELRESLENLARDVGLKDKIHFLGFRLDIEKLYWAADVFVFPSKREGLGLAAIEAMASGLPMIAADNRGTREYAQDGVTGCCVDPWSVEQMRTSIEKMVEDGAFRSQCGRNNMNIARRFDLQRSLEAQQRIYREMLEQSGEK